MTEAEADALDEAAANFAFELHQTLSNTFPGPFLPFNVLVSEGKSGHRNVLITQEPRLGIDLKAVDGDRLFTVQLKYKCTWDGDYLAVEESEFKIGLSGVSEPLLRFDYLRHPLGGLAGAHVNVHAHRDEFIYAMARAGKKEQLNSSGLSIPKLSHLHIPVGGKRFRLTWLICLVREFWVADGVENGLLFGGDVGGECLVGAIDGDGR